MKYLITGGAGFIGSNLAEKLKKDGHDVVIIDNLTTGRKKNLPLDVEFYEADILDIEKIRPFFSGVDGVFHLAAIPRVPLSIQDPVKTSNVNIMGTVNVFKCAIDEGIKRIVFASSSSIYGGQKVLPLQEDMLPNPLSPYGLQKLVGEQIAKMFSDLYKIQIVCLRYFNVYGPKIDFDSDYSLVIGKFLRLKSQGKPLTIFGDGNQSRAFCFIEDVVDANIRAMQSDKIKGGEVFNIGQKKSHSVNFLAKLIGGEVQYLPPRIGDPMHTQADTTKAESVLGWSPKTDFETGVNITKNWFEKNYGK